MRKGGRFAATAGAGPAQGAAAGESGDPGGSCWTDGVSKPSRGREGRCRCLCISHSWAFILISWKGEGEEAVGPLHISSAVSCLWCSVCMYVCTVYMFCVCACLHVLTGYTCFGSLRLDLGTRSCCSLASLGLPDLATGTFSDGWCKREQTHRWEEAAR